MEGKQQTRFVKLSRNEKNIAVVPERCSGPGWANAPTWVIIVNNTTNEFRQECIQPDEPTLELDTLYSTGAVVCDALKRAVKVDCRKDRGK